VLSRRDQTHPRPTGAWSGACRWRPRSARHGPAHRDLHPAFSSSAIVRCSEAWMRSALTSSNSRVRCWSRTRSCRIFSQAIQATAIASNTSTNGKPASKPDFFMGAPGLRLYTARLSGLRQESGVRRQTRDLRLAALLPRAVDRAPAGSLQHKELGKPGGKPPRAAELRFAERRRGATPNLAAKFSARLECGDWSPLSRICGEPETGSLLPFYRGLWIERGPDAGSTGVPAVRAASRLERQHFRSQSGDQSPHSRRFRGKIRGLFGVRRPAGMSYAWTGRA